MHLVPVYVTLFFVNGIVPPYLPILVRNLGYRTAVVGILLAIAEGSGILGPLLYCRLADKYGKYKSFIILSYCIMAAVILPLAFFVHPVANAFFIILFAIGHRSAMPLIDAVTTIKLGEKGNYGRIRVFGSIAYVCFVLFLQWVPVLRPNTSINIAIWICITSMLAIVPIVLLPSEYTNRKSPLQDTSITVKETEQKNTIWTPFFIMGLFVIALSRLAMTTVETFFPLFLVEYMQWDAVGLMMALSGISEIPFIFFSNRLIRRFGAMPLIAFTSTMVALRLGLYAVFPFKAGIIIAQLLHSFCFGLFHPAAISFISLYVPPKQRSFGMTLYLSLGWALPMFIGNFIGGFIVDYAGYRSLFGYFTVFAILGTVIYLVWQLNQRKRPD